MSWAVIRPQIKTLLETNISELGEVSKAPKLKFDSYPSAYIVASENEADYETTTENIRTYAFNVYILDTTKDQNIENATLAVEEVVDKVLDLFDQEDLKSSATRIIGINLPSRYTYINIWATPGRWGEIPEEELLLAEIKIRIRISVDIS